jgi:hypothetical protein
VKSIYEVVDRETAEVIRPTRPSEPDRLGCGRHLWERRGARFVCTTPRCRTVIHQGALHYEALDRWYTAFTLGA